eukprot:1155728-Pelagomonas_calceolata.AAC.4
MNTNCKRKRRQEEQAQNLGRQEGQGQEKTKKARGTGAKKFKENKGDRKSSFSVLNITSINDTIRPVINLGLIRQKAKPLASTLSYHAIQRLTNIISAMYALHLLRGFRGGARHEAVDSRRRVRASGAWPMTFQTPISSVSDFLQG